MNYKELAVNPFKLEMQTRLADTDSLGHLNNVAYVEFLESARTYWHDYVKEDPRSLETWDWILGGINIIFKKEAYLSDKLTIWMWCSRIGSKSWDFSYAIVNQDNDLILEASTSQISYDYKQKVSQPIAKDLLADLKQRLGKPWP